MKLVSLRLENFKSFSDAKVDFDEGLTILVGENGSGKSSIGDALRESLELPSISVPSRRYGESQCKVTLSLSLKAEEVESWLISPIVDVLRGEAIALSHQLRDYLRGNGGALSIEIDGSPTGPLLRWRTLCFHESSAYVGEYNRAANRTVLISDLITGKNWIEALEGSANTTRFEIHVNIVDVLRSRIRERLAIIPDFRKRNEASARSGALQALDGSLVASVLLNLRVNSNLSEEERYDRIISKFHDLFPQFRIQAVEKEAGGGRAEVMFRSLDTSQTLSLSQVSAGLQESLTLITNLAARKDLVYFVEHPENHLHAHATRAFYDLIKEAADSNQIIVATHSLYFVDPTNPGGLRRLSLLEGKGSIVNSVPKKALNASTSEGGQLLGRIATAFRKIENREAVFSRAVLLVEDESQYEFFRGISGRVKPLLDPHGVSVIYTDGQDGFRTFVPILQGLGIPFIAVRDLPWGDDTKYPPSQYMCLGKELEDYLDENGLGELRKQAMEAGGAGSKRRTAAIMGQTVTEDKIPPTVLEILNQVVRLAVDKAIQGS